MIWIFLFALLLPDTRARRREVVLVQSDDVMPHRSFTFAFTLRLTRRPADVKICCVTLSVYRASLRLTTTARKLQVPVQFAQSCGLQGVTSSGKRSGSFKKKEKADWTAHTGCLNNALVFFLFFFT